MYKNYTKIKEDRKNYSLFYYYTINTKAPEENKWLKRITLGLLYICIKNNKKIICQNI
jgi:hypothetical protein